MTTKARTSADDTLSEDAKNLPTDKTENTGKTEGELHAASYELGSGHEANVVMWENSPAGKQWLEGEKDRQKAQKAEDEKVQAAQEEADKRTEEAKKAFAEA